MLFIKSFKDARNCEDTDFAPFFFRFLLDDAFDFDSPWASSADAGVNNDFTNGSVDCVNKETMAPFKVSLFFSKKPVLSYWTTPAKCLTLNHEQCALVVMRAVIFACLPRGAGWPWALSIFLKKDCGEAETVVKNKNRD